MRLALPLTVHLSDPRARAATLSGRKAARLATLLQAGFEVPAGIVLTTAPFTAALAAGWGSGLRGTAVAVLPDEVRAGLRGACSALGSWPLAVRSSAEAEDLPDASFAGLYRTVLDVGEPAGVEEAVARCWLAALGPAVAGYRAATGAARAGGGLAVLLQVQFRPEVSGVALTADPISGARDRVVVTAVGGRGDGLVAGVVAADEWSVVGRVAVPVRTPNGVLDASVAVRAADLARRVQARADAQRPQDVEWALAGGRMTVLQARPMTSLPPQVSWQPPRRGGWLRDIRLGEWLPEPLSPLFATWLLPAIESSFARAQAADLGFFAPPPLHVLVNGWYFHSPVGDRGLPAFVRALLSHPRAGIGFGLARQLPRLADAVFVRAILTRWRGEVQPRYRAAVRAAALDVPTATPPGLARIVDDLARPAGEGVWHLVIIGGSAWRFEAALAAFCRRRLPAVLDHGHQALLAGLTRPVVAGHAVYSIDWLRPTLGELPAGVPAPPDRGDPHSAAAAGRRRAEAACREELARSRPLSRRFDRLLALARYYAAAREELTANLTLAWPVLRAAAGRLGDALVAAGVLADREDVFFLERAEVFGDAADLRDAVVSRRAEWAARRRLTPPARIGRVSRPIERFLAPGPLPGGPCASTRTGGLTGIAVSPGRATGPARIVEEPAQLSQVRRGDVLVVATPSPALVALYPTIAALASDGGSITAHAALTAREFGVPAVMGLLDATKRLRNGQLVTVDGSEGVLWP